MTECEVSNAIKEIAGAIGIASSEIIPHYARWYIFASIGYMIFGLCISIGGIWWFKTAGKDIDRPPAILILVIALFVGGLFFFVQVGDLLAPQGIAIHQFIGDIRG